MSIFKRKYNINDEIATLQAELSTIAETKEIVQSEWWKKMRSMMIDKMIVLDREIVALSSNPTGNDDAIRGKHSLRTAIKGLLGGVETTLNAESEIIKKLKQLKETAEIAELAS